MAFYLITDGAYSSSRNRMGYAFIMLKDDTVIYKYSRGVDGGTNNIAEISAIIMGLKSIKSNIDSLHIVSDSQYSLGVMFKGWKRNKNQKLLEIFDYEYDRVKKLCPSITYEHVRGHHKGTPTKWDIYNEECDKMAVNETK